MITEVLKLKSLLLGRTLRDIEADRNSVSFTFSGGAKISFSGNFRVDASPGSSVPDVVDVDVKPTVDTPTPTRM